ncbi:MAG: hypothetical protein JXA10_08870 [Anaerolineae bacterium]|nr:hypothetical protein [Anaerolineae bacterium]
MWNLANLVKAFYVHKSVGKTNLTSAQTTALVFGEITNWSEVGELDLDIVFFVR